MHAENIADKHFKIFFVRNCLNNARLGIVASKKLLPNAADRNRAQKNHSGSFSPPPNQAL